MARPYRIELLPSAVKELEGLAPAHRHRVATAIDGLKEVPRPAGAVQLRGSDGVLRVRAGDYRILYRVFDRRLVVLVIRIGHRREVYRAVVKRLRG
ncbi:MAG: type II toxin-antitoxin system RelE/ParE family toxin [Chloroflexota bacterium]